MQKPTAKRRAALYTANFIYKQRREVIKKEIGGTPEYAGRVKTITRKIATRNQAMARIDKRNNKIMAIGNAVAYFTGYNVKNMGSEDLNHGEKNMVKGGYLAACIFSKYGIENGIGGNFLSEYMNRPTATASRRRLAFTRGWKKHPEWKEQYKRFKEYIKK